MSVDGVRWIFLVIRKDHGVDMRPDFDSWPRTRAPEY